MTYKFQMGYRSIDGNDCDVASKGELLNANAQNSSRSPVLDYIKAVCILFVVITHINWSNAQKSTLLFPFTIDMAVPVFMIISGYVNMMSSEKHNLKRLRDWYLPNTILPKLFTIIMPYLLIYIILAVVNLVIGAVNAKGAVIAFFEGGWGPGSYYVPVLIQFTFLFPLMVTFVKKCGKYGYIVLLMINVLLEACFTYFKVPVGIYRLCFFRYIIFVLAGMYLYTSKGRINKVLLSISFLFGFFYILAANYLGYKPIIFTNWVVTSFPTVFYIFPIITLIVTYFNKPIPKVFGGWVLGTIGKSTYHIFLFQMLWYSSLGNLLPPWIVLVPNVIICLYIGVKFSNIDNRFVQIPLRKLINKCVDGYYKNKSAKKQNQQNNQ